MTPPHWQDATAPGGLLHALTTHARFGLLSDVDGTLSPIVMRPEDAQLLPGIREQLAALAARLPLVALVSGRSAADLHARVGLDAVTYVGNHGLETWEDGGVQPLPEALAHRDAVQQAAARIEQGLLPSTWVENKAITLSVHYRQADDVAAARTHLLGVVTPVAEALGLNVFEGRMIVEVRPPVDLHKGTAFTRLVQAHDLGAAIFLGDDVTDVDAFRAARALRESGACYALSLGVLAEGAPPVVAETCDVAASGVEDVSGFLGWLAKAFSASST